MRGAILRRTMDRALARRAVVVGQLIFAAPAITAILLVPFLGWYMFGPFLFVYYVLAGVTFGWQWYALALPGWKQWLARNGVQDEEAQQLTHRAGLAWLGEGKIGPFALHTTAAAVCGVYLGPWLLSRWFVWILPLAGSVRAPTGTDYLQHFEVASVVPAFVVGYVLSLYFRRQATWAWIVPTGVLVYWCTGVQTAHIRRSVCVGSGFPLLDPILLPSSSSSEPGPLLPLTSVGLIPSVLQSRCS